MKAIISLTLTSFLTLNSFASAFDVTPAGGLKKGDTYVKVSRLKEERIQFQKCISGLEQSTCESIGNKDSYSIKELLEQRDIENSETLYAFGADVAIGVVAVVAWVGTFGASGVVVAGSAAIIGGGAAYSMSHFDAINPLEQSAQWRTLNEKVISDYSVVVPKNEMNVFIERLDLVLSKIE
jgi:hypothetical protein